MAVKFKFEEYPSAIFGKIRRPIAKVLIHHKKYRSWQPITMIVDTGADYTLLPKFMAVILGVSLEDDCKAIETQGVGGKSTVYLLKQKVRAKIGRYERTIPIGFIDSDSLPPLLGRQEFFETFKVVFEKYSTTFS